MRNDIAIWCLDWHLDKSYAESIFNTKNIFYYPKDNANYCKNIAVVFYIYDNFSELNLDDYDLVICIGPEPLIDPHFSRSHAQKLCHNNNVVFITDQFGPVPAFVCPNYHYWFDRVGYGNTFIDTNLPNKNKMFDCLLGSKREMRVEMFRLMQKFNLLENSLVSLVDNTNLKNPNIPNYRSPELDMYELAICKQLFDMSTYYESLSTPEGCATTLSCVVPYDIYKHSYYSLVNETVSSSVVFFTEKTVKPLYAKRLFLTMSTEGSLTTLNENGFETFSDVVDESYDQIQDPYARCNAVVAAAKQLSLDDPALVYQKIKGRLDHNHTMVLEMYSKTMKSLREFISEQIDKLF